MWFLTVLGLIEARRRSSSCPCRWRSASAPGFMIGKLRTDRLGDLGLGARRADPLQHLAGDMGRDDDSPIDAARMPAISSSIEASFIRYPHAPARIASSMSASWSEIVSTTTRVNGAAVVTWRVASTPRHSRHVEIHHDDVRRELTDESHSVRAVACFSDDLDALLLEQVPKPRAEEIVVVHENDANRRLLHDPLVGCFERHAQLFPRCHRDPPVGWKCTSEA